MDVFSTLSTRLQRAIDDALGDDDEISLANVPRALQRLDLPPDDDQVLAVFRNAASGWSASDSATVDSTGGGCISRDDWRSVCAVLLENSNNDIDDDDQYNQDDGDDDDDGDSGDEYIPNARSPSPPSSAHKLTKRQHATSLQAFSLFFPDVPPEDIPKQRIMIKDIQRVADLLGEKIKAEDIIEMLDAFSSSPDKSISLEDFGRIMVTAQLA